MMAKTIGARLKRFFSIIFYIIVGILVIDVCGIAILFYHGLPDYSGHWRMPGLAARVEIYRDNYGVPHIFANSPKDAARALGYVHASERMFQMEMQRRAGQGRLAEIVGADMLDVDEFTRTLGLYKLAQSSFAAMSPEARAYFQAYADGVNTWLVTNRNKLPPEFLMLGDTPEPWTPADSVVWGKLMGLQLSHNYKLEILRAELEKKIPPEQMSWLFPMPPENAPITTQPAPIAAHHDSTSIDSGDKLASFLGLDHAASNEWVIGGARTVSGKPILANDPHLGLEAPILWFLTRIVTPQGSVKGATVPGLPIVLLGENDNVAWGFTTTGSDVQDLFIETVDPTNPHHYMTPDGSMPFDEHDEIFHVKNAPDFTLTVRATRHGPVMSDINEKMATLAGNGKVMALAFTGLDGKDRTAEALLQMNYTHNAAELLDALKLYQTPPQNIVYADKDGAFGYINPGFVPVRKSGDGLMPADGASGDYDWTGIIPFERDPHIANPEAGYVFNANNAIVGTDSSDYFGKDWEETYRALRLQQFFDKDEKFTLPMAQQMQADHLSLAAKDLLPMLLFVTPQDDRAKQALGMLQKWDGVMDKDSAEPVIFEAWLYQLHNHMLTQKTENDMNEKGPFAASTIIDLVSHHAQDWCGDSNCHAIISQSFADAMNMMTQRQGQDITSWRWGHENVAMLQHKFYKHIPLLKSISDLSVESSGDFYTLDRGGGFDNDETHPFARTHGGGFRGIYDLGNPDASLFMIATGQSGHIVSPHYGDLVQKWNNVQAITLSGTAEQLKNSGAAEVILDP